MVYELDEERWVELLSEDHRPYAEQVVLIRRLQAHTLSIAQVDWKRCFGDWPGIALKRGPGVMIVRAEGSSRAINLPRWVAEQLELGPGDTVCLVHSSAPAGFTLRKFVLAESSPMPTAVPATATSTSAPSPLFLFFFRSSVLSLSRPFFPFLFFFRSFVVTVLSSIAGTWRQRRASAWKKRLTSGRAMV
ncbi:MAG TPA: hypothetical protein VM223_22615 [Planctomycetota bacterium]|nr:hypothetical protein [Planctomycetota bacterium]